MALTLCSVTVYCSQTVSSIPEVCEERRGGETAHVSGGAEKEDPHM